VESATVPTVVPSIAAVKVVPLSVSDSVCHRPVPNADVVPPASVRQLPPVLLLRIDQAPVSATRK
jgi:hypothetical protein